MEKTFSQKEYNLKFSGILLQINDIENNKEVGVISKVIDEYEVEYKLRQYAWQLNEDITELRRELNKKSIQIIDEKKKKLV